MATSTITYATKTAITISLASLADDNTNQLAGRESNEIDNSSNLYLDALVQGYITVGTTPTANRQIWVYVWGSDTSAATTNLDVIDGVDSAETLTNAGIRNSLLRLGAVIDVSATTSDLDYHFAPFSVASLFGGVMPKYWGLMVINGSGVALNSTGGNHVINFTGIKYASA
jgi:hypothetical protein